MYKAKNEKQSYKYTIDDIDIFIITHKRSHYIGESLMSLIKQTAGIKEITVLDNEATGETEEVLKQFENYNVKLNYFTTEGYVGNFNKAQELATKKYCMLFHDDDLVHPMYLEYVLKALNKYKNVTFLTTTLTEFWNDRPPKFVKKPQSAHFFFSKQSDFTRRMFFSENIAYATVVYRTTDFKQEKYDLEAFGRLADWPLMVRLSGYGNTILFHDPALLLTRRHEKQELFSNNFAPTPQQLINRDRLFYTAMKINILEPTVFIAYVQKALYFLYGLYDTFVTPEEKLKTSKKQLVKLAAKDGHIPLRFYVILHNIFFNKITRGITNVRYTDRKIKISFRLAFIEFHLISYKYKKFIKRLT